MGKNNGRSLRKRAESFRYAFCGLRELMAGEPNAWIHLFAACCAVLAGIVLSIAVYEWLFVIFAIGFVFFAEAFNSAVERLADKTCPEHDSLIGAAKDLAAGGVLIAAITAAVVGLVIFVPKICVLF